MNPLGAAGHIARDAGRAAERSARIAGYQQQTAQRAQEMAGQLHAQVAVRPPAALLARVRPDAPALLRRTLEGMGLLFTDYVAFPSRSSVIAVTTRVLPASSTG